MVQKIELKHKRRVFVNLSRDIIEVSSFPGLVAGLRVPLGLKQGAISWWRDVLQTCAIVGKRRTVYPLSCVAR